MLRSKAIPVLYILSTILIALPPFQVISGFPSQHGLSRAIWIFIAFLYGYSIIKNKEVINKKHYAFLWVYLIYLFSQALSVINAFNIVTYIETMKEVVIMGTFILSTLWISQQKYAGKLFLVVILTTTTIDLVQYALLYFFPGIVNSSVSGLLNQEFLNFINFNLDRGRLYIESYSDAYLPLLLYVALNKTGLLQKTTIISSSALTVFIYLTNFRSKFITLLFSIITTTIILSKKIKTLLFVLIPSIIIIIFFTNGAVLVRFDMFGSDNENFRTIESRLVNWEMALDMGITNPIFGVGSGNYFDYVDSSLKRGMTIFKEIEREFNYGITDPHNILVKTFAETGLVGISGLIVLLAFFVSKDITILKSKNTFLKLLVIGFWTVFIYSMANPGYTVKYLMNYWMFRLMIQAEVSI